MDGSRDNGAPRNTEAILRAALGELVDREDRLAPFVAELEGTRRAIKVIEKALGDPRKAGHKPKAAHQLSRRSGMSGKEKVLAALGGSVDPLGYDELEERTGATRSTLYQAISELRKAHRVVEVEPGRFGLAAVAVGEME
jgi:DNA-binding transcriptional ArsR family regulator